MKKMLEIFLYNQQLKFLLSQLCLNGLTEIYMMN